MKRTKKMFALAASALLAASLFAGCKSEDAKTVSTDGSTSMESVIGALGEAFEAEHSDVTFTYNPTGSSSGIQAVSEGRCDIGLSSRALSEEEKASGLTETILAYDGIAIIVNPENPVTDLSLEQIAAIYKGEITNWSEVGGNDAEIVLIVHVYNAHYLMAALECDLLYHAAHLAITNKCDSHIFQTVC